MGVSWDIQSVSTIILASVAIITVTSQTLKHLHKWLCRPRLSLTFEQGDPFCRVTSTSDFICVANVIPTYWIRLKVINKGESMAKLCLGKCIKVMNDKGEYIKEYDPMRLHWDSTRWKDIPFATIDLSRDESAYLDTLVAQNNRIFFAGDQHPWAQYEQRAIPNFLSSGTYILLITVYGNEIKPVTKYVSVVIPEGDLLSATSEARVKVSISDCLQDAKSSFRK